MDQEHCSTAQCPPSSLLSLPRDPPHLGGGSCGTPALGVKGSQGWMEYDRVLLPGEMKPGKEKAP